MQKTTVISFDGDVSKIKESLVSLELEFRRKNSGSNFVWQGKCKDGVITAYKTGKIVIQGQTENWVNNVSGLLGKSDSSDGEIEGFAVSSFIPHIGVDEAGKGDYFGPMVIAAVFVESTEIRDKLLSIGVRDSKKISDSRAIRLREEISNICKGIKGTKGTSEVVISPVKYDELYKKFRNVNKLLAWGHARSIENVLEELPKGVCHDAVIDQFSKHKFRVLDALMKNGKRLDIKQKHKGESDIAVAAASILARGRFLLELQKLRDKYRVEFPKGANNCVVLIGKEFVKEFGVEKLDDVAKLSFRTTLKITSTFDI